MIAPAFNSGGRGRSFWSAKQNTRRLQFYTEKYCLMGKGWWQLTYIISAFGNVRKRPWIKLCVLSACEKTLKKTSLVTSVTPSRGLFFVTGNRRGSATQWKGGNWSKGQSFDWEGGAEGCVGAFGPRTASGCSYWVADDPFRITRFLWLLSTDFLDNKR